MAGRVEKRASTGQILGFNRPRMVESLDVELGEWEEKLLRSLMSVKRVEGW